MLRLWLLLLLLLQLLLLSPLLGRLLLLLLGRLLLRLLLILSLWLVRRLLLLRLLCYLSFATTATALGGLSFVRAAQDRANCDNPEGHEQDHSPPGHAGPFAGPRGGWCFGRMRGRRHGYISLMRGNSRCLMNRSAAVSTEPIFRA